jgi:hypothetical protein
MESKWAKLGCFAAIFGFILNRQINREIKQLDAEARLAERDEEWQSKLAKAKLDVENKPKAPPTATPTSEGDAHNGFGGYQSGGYN